MIDNVLSIIIRTSMEYCVWLHICHRNFHIVHVKVLCLMNAPKLGVSGVGMLLLLILHGCHSNFVVAVMFETALLILIVS